MNVDILKLYAMGDRIDFIPKIGGAFQYIPSCLSLSRKHSQDKNTRLLSVPSLVPRGLGFTACQQKGRFWLAAPGLLTASRSLFHNFPDLPLLSLISRDNSLKLIKAYHTKTNIYIYIYIFKKTNLYIYIYIYIHMCVYA